MTPDLVTELEPWRDLRDNPFRLNTDAQEELHRSYNELVNLRWGLCRLPKLAILSGAIFMISAWINIYAFIGIPEITTAVKIHNLAFGLNLLDALFYAGLALFLTGLILYVVRRSTINACLYQLHYRRSGNSLSPDWLLLRSFLIVRANFVPRPFVKAVITSIETEPHRWSMNTCCYKRDDNLELWHTNSKLLDKKIWAPIRINLTLLEKHLLCRAIAKQQESHSTNPITVH